MAKKSSAKEFFIRDVKTDKLLLAYDNRRKWRFHAIIGDPFPSEELAKETLEYLVKSKAIPDSEYQIF